ncbi:MAG: tetratricopeptide repeat protein [Vicinamibacterales bacterium]
MAGIRVGVALLAAGLGLVVGRVSAVADTWIEVTSPNFRVISNAGEGAARNAAWQFEQIRAGIQAGWPWARADLDRPFVVIAVRGESTMKQFAPQYWEDRNRIRPASVSATGADRHFVVLRTDVRTDGDSEGVSPYQVAYWSYTQLVLSDSFDYQLPLWFGRGLSSVLSNSIVTDREIQFGRAIPWYIQEVRQGGRIGLPELLSVDRDSPLFRGEIERQRYDAQCWALMHFLVFGDADREGSATRLNELAKLTLQGTSSVQAVQQVYGDLDRLDSAYRTYLDRGLFRYSIMRVDARFDKKLFPLVPVPEPEALALRADFLVTSSRLEDARAAIAEARKTAPDLASAFVAEARLLERERKTDEARAAYERAVALGTPNFYAWVRLANLMPRQGAGPDELETTRGLLAKAVELNPAYAIGHQSLGGVLLQMGRTDEAITAIRRAIALDPRQPGAHLTLASALLRGGQREEALQEARAALALSRTDAQRNAAQGFIQRIGGTGQL